MYFIHIFAHFSFSWKLPSIGRQREKKTRTNTVECKKKQLKEKDAETKKYELKSWKLLWIYFVELLLTRVVVCFVAYRPFKPNLKLYLEINIDVASQSKIGVLTLQEIQYWCAPSKKKTINFFFAQSTKNRSTYTRISNARRAIFRFLFIRKLFSSAKKQAHIKYISNCEPIDSQMSNKWNCVYSIFRSWYDFDILNESKSFRKDFLSHSAFDSK